MFRVGSETFYYSSRIRIRIYFFGSGSEKNSYGSTTLLILYLTHKKIIVIFVRKSFVPIKFLKTLPCTYTVQ
jgi:hypothetical protein